MASLNAHYIGKLSDEELVRRALPFLDSEPTDQQREAMVRAAPFLKPRMKLLADMVSAAGFLLLQRPFEITGKAGKPLRKEGTADILQGLGEALTSVEDWSAATLDLAVQTYAETHGLGFGQVGPPLRAALTAGNPAPTLGETLYALGREESLARIREACAPIG
jgi:glutamyl-tRNA synthetase